MINADVRTGEGATLERTPTRKVYRLNARVFRILLIAEVLVIVAALAWVANYRPQPATSRANTNDVAVVHEAIWARFVGTVHDPLIEVQPGISVRESNVRGFRLNGTIYYYYIEGNQNFDPFSRGVVSSDRIEVLLRDDAGPLPLVIYTLHAPPSPE